MKIFLLQNFYLNPRRESELRFCLEKNDANRYLDKIILAVEKKTEATNAAVQDLAKIIQIETGREREKYSDLFSLAEKHIPEDNLVILSNLDIFFDESVKHLFDFEFWQDTVMALTRWDYQSDGSAKPFRVDNSQDAWIWRTPLRHREMIADFALGEPGCDNRIAYELAKDYNVINPSKTIRCYHCHPFECPDYSQVEKVPPPYRKLPRTTLGKAKKQRTKAGKTSTGVFKGLYDKLTNR